MQRFALPYQSVGVEPLEQLRDSFIEGIRVTRDKVFRIIHSQVDYFHSIIRKEDVVQIDEPLTHQEIIDRFPVGKEYLYKKIVDKEIIKVRLLRIDGNYAILGLRVELGHLEKRLESLCDHVIFPDFSKKQTPLPVNQELPESKPISIQEKRLTPQFILSAFEKHHDLGRREQEVLSRSPLATLKLISDSDTHLAGIHQLSHSDFPTLSPDQKHCLETILSLSDVDLRTKALALFVKSYREFLKVRQSFLLALLMTPQSLGTLSSDQLFSLVEFYDDWTFEQGTEFTRKIQKDIHIFLNSRANTNEILAFKLKQYLSPTLLTPTDFKQIYDLAHQ